jgi:hypothetical protein
LFIDFLVPEFNKLLQYVELAPTVGSPSLPSDCCGIGTQKENHALLHKLAEDNRVLHFERKL